MNGLQVCSVVFQSILIKSNKFNCLDYKDWQIQWFSEVIEFVVNYESRVNNFSLILCFNRLCFTVFTLGIFTAVKEFTYLGKFLVNVNIN